MRKVVTHIMLPAFFLAGAVSSGWFTPAAPPTSKMPQRLKASPRLQGALTCSAAACHHGNGPSGTPGSEYTTWALHDPHARAYDTLLTERSKKMAAHIDPTRAAEANPLCLNCHVYPGVLENPRASGFALRDGVSCEACHGPAEHWLHEHHKAKPNRQTLGMRDTRDLTVRAEVCVRCHVGQPGNEVTHDLIAAGHPPLRFEFAAYLANYPRHWRQPTHDEAHAWLIGQRLSARTRLECQLARVADTDAVWPELADFDCFDCHHDLEKGAWRQAVERPGERRAGVPRLNRWYNWHADPALRKEQADFERAMSWPAVKREKIKEHGDNLLARLQQTIETLARSRPSQDAIQHLHADLVERVRKGRLQSWDEHVQTYLGIAALGTKSNETSAALQELYSELRFPDDYDSPRNFVPGFLRK